MWNVIVKIAASFWAQRRQHGGSLSEDAPMATPDRDRWKGATKIEAEGAFPTKPMQARARTAPHAGRRFRRFPRSTLRCCRAKKSEFGEATVRKRSPDGDRRKGASEGRDRAVSGGSDCSAPPPHNRRAQGDRRPPAFSLLDVYIRDAPARSDRRQHPPSGRIHVHCNTMPAILSAPSIQPLPKAPGSDVDFGAVITGLDVENMSGK